MLEKAGSSQNRTNPLITPKFTEYLKTLRVRLCFTTPLLTPSSSPSSTQVFAAQV